MILNVCFTPCCDQKYLKLNIIRTRDIVNIYIRIYQKFYSQLIINAIVCDQDYFKLFEKYALGKIMRTTVVYE